MSECLSLTMFYGSSVQNFSNIAWTMGVATLLLSPITITGNGLVLASILLDPFKNIRRKPSSYIIFNLALADLLVGAFGNPMLSIALIYIAVYNRIERALNSIILITVAVPIGVSLFSLIVLSLDRLIAIKIPLKYAYKVTRTRIRNINVSTWIYNIIFSIMPLFLCSNTSYFIIGISHTAIASIVLIVLNSGLVFSVRTQAKSIKKTVDSENRGMLQNAFNREKGVTRTAVILVVTFQSCLLPFVVFSSITSTTDAHLTEAMLWIHYSGTTLVFLNSLINPLLYAWRLPKYRKAFQYILNKIKNKVCFVTVQPTANTSRHLARRQDTSNSVKLNVSLTLNKSSTRFPVSLGSSVTESVIKKNLYGKNNEGVQNTKL